MEVVQIEVYIVIASLSDRWGGLIDRWVSGVYKDKSGALEWVKRITKSREELNPGEDFSYSVVTEKVQ